MDREASSIGRVWHIEKTGIKILTLRIEEFDEENNLIHGGFIRGQIATGNVMGISDLNLICKRFHLSFDDFHDCFIA